MMSEVGASISFMPGPPLGPSYRMTTKCPSFTLPCMIPALASSSESKQIALPVNLRIEGWIPAVFTTAPSGARFPNRTARPPTGE